MKANDEILDIVGWKRIKVLMKQNNSFEKYDDLKNVSLSKGILKRNNAEIKKIYENFNIKYQNLFIQEYKSFAQKYILTSKL